MCGRAENGEEVEAEDDDSSSITGKASSLGAQNETTEPSMPITEPTVYKKQCQRRLQWRVQWLLVKLKRTIGIGSCQENSYNN